MEGSSGVKIFAKEGVHGIKCGVAALVVHGALGLEARDVSDVRSLSADRSIRTLAHSLRSRVVRRGSEETAMQRQPALEVRTIGQRKATHRINSTYKLGRSSAGGAQSAACVAAPSAADGLRGLYYARLAERYCTKLNDNHCKQVFEYLKGAQ